MLDLGAAGFPWACFCECKPQPTRYPARMFLWMIAVCVLAMVVTVSYYQGAIRAAISLIGLVVSAALALPLSVIPKALLPVFGMKHPVILDFVCPVVMFIVLVSLFKTGAFFLHRKVATYYKYKGSETQSGLWERMQQRVGACLGVVNGVIYIFLLGILFAIPGYYTMQMATSEKDHWCLRFSNTINRDMQASHFDKAVALFNPATKFYYDAVDILSYIFHTPLLQQRLSIYPIFLPLSEENRFQEMSKDKDFQQFWLKGPTIGEFIAHARIKPLVQEPEFYTNMVGLVQGDLQDLKTYLETGQSEKYGDEPIIGPWQFSYNATFQQARRSRPNMPAPERKYLQTMLKTVWSGSEVVAYLDNTFKLQSRSGKAIKGRWKRNYATKYTLTWSEGGQSADYEAVIEGRKITVTQDKLALIFNR